MTGKMKDDPDVIKVMKLLKVTSLVVSSLSFSSIKPFLSVNVVSSILANAVCLFRSLCLVTKFISNTV